MRIPAELVCGTGEIRHVGSALLQLRRMRQVPMEDLTKQNQCHVRFPTGAPHGNVPIFWLVANNPKLGLKIAVDPTLPTPVSFLSKDS